MNTAARFKEHFPKGRDLTLIILKSHLLVEERMNGLLDLSLPNPSALYRAKFGSCSDCVFRRFGQTPKLTH
jgi:hypothetical protein